MLAWPSAQEISERGSDRTNNGTDGWAVAALQKLRTRICLSKTSFMEDGQCHGTKTTLTGGPSARRLSHHGTAVPLGYRRRGAAGRPAQAPSEQGTELRLERRACSKHGDRRLLLPWSPGSLLWPSPWASLAGMSRTSAM